MSPRTGRHNPAIDAVIVIIVIIAVTGGSRGSEPVASPCHLLDKTACNYGTSHDERRDTVRRTAHHGGRALAPPPRVPDTARRRAQCRHRWPASCASTPDPTPPIWCWTWPGYVSSPPPGSA